MMKILLLLAALAHAGDITVLGDAKQGVYFDAKTQEFHSYSDKDVVARLLATEVSVRAARIQELEAAAARDAAALKACKGKPDPSDPAYAPCLGMFLKSKELEACFKKVEAKNSLSPKPAAAKAATK